MRKKYNKLNHYLDIRTTYLKQRIYFMQKFEEKAEDLDRITARMSELSILKQLVLDGGLDHVLLQEEPK